MIMGLNSVAEEVPVLRLVDSANWHVSKSTSQMRVNLCLNMVETERAK